ncbi:D-alanyl-D-alanine carboxypeptidase family protein [Saccharothrix syringae]|uniref:D-alanyl-D-alanine carboxypeptidase-like core domain-containing protein n=1 Tax=Saccharothrix syringae TaxID=103733 RepID=A0A5Q0H7G4_SACSY|nr:D-alanyl-D-alanine carboxypeptidase family protein [Saccharothrix syringae]QFZ22141.1 hypothetical protein EKG83_36255 [Saccharothrix syringae]
MTRPQQRGDQRRRTATAEPPRAPTRLPPLLALQRAAGNAATTRLLATVQRCGPEPCDCDTEERERHEERQVQRAVREGVVAEPSTPRPNPATCMVHLHGNEVNGLRAAQSLVPRCDVNLVHLTNTTRHIHVTTGGGTCEADPNRIFSDTALNALWPRWNRGRCARDPVKADAIAQITAFRDQQLWPAIRRCMGVPGTLEEEAREGMCREGAPIAAFHNNDPSPSIDILAYCPGPGGPPACGGRLGSEARDNRATDTTDVPADRNPHIAPGQDKDDFFLVTKRADFDGLVAQGRNVVLQSPNARDDGSLSARFAHGRYANVEAELGGPQARNDAMGEEAVTRMGATCTPVQRDTAPPRTASPETSETEGLDGLLSWLRRLLGEVVRVLEQTATTPAATEREAPPPTLPRSCRTFADQGALDAAKARISTSVIGRMADRDVISWVVGLTPPPTAVTREATEQRDCMLAAIRAAARRPGSGITLPAGSLAHSDHRGFAQQRAIWDRKFTFADRAHGGRPFDRISDGARTRCAPALGADVRWDPDNPAHRRCWLTVLTDDERQQEILQASSAPGISRHHWGTDFDLFDADMNPDRWRTGGAFADEYGWLQRNASTYGFVQSFTTTSAFMSAGYMEERWHWSYYPAAQALLEFARGHQADVEARLLAEWGTSPRFSFIRARWRDFMFNVNERGWF